MSTPDTQRWALTLSYDGSRFYGWQKQAGGVPTVQTALENALAQIAGEAVSTIVAGRTDTGVMRLPKSFILILPPSVRLRHGYAA